MKLDYLGHQGDVVIFEVDEFPEGARETNKQTELGILAYGELSGHAHQFTELDTQEVFKIKTPKEEYGKLLFINVKSERGATLIHGRARDFVGREADHNYHKALVLRSGRKYVTGIVEETDWLTRTIKKVVD
jgi:hypothetical protein